MKLKHDELLSSFAFNYYLRRYRKVSNKSSQTRSRQSTLSGYGPDQSTLSGYVSDDQSAPSGNGSDQSAAGAYTRPLLSST